MALWLPSYVIVKRELVTSLRRVRTLLLVVALVWVAGGIVLTMWPMDNIPAIRAGGQAQEMLMMLSYTLLFGCMLCVPGLAAATIVSEREQETLDALYLTLVRPSGVVAAKAVNTVGVYMLLIVGTFPVFATVMFGVGLDVAQLAFTLILLTATAASCAMIGILCSTFFRRSYVALAAAYGFTVFFMGGPSYLVGFAGMVFGRRMYYYYLQNPRTQDFQFLLSPFTVLAGIHAQIMTPVRFAVAIGLQMLFCLGCFLFSMHFLRRQTQPRPVKGEKPIEDPAVLHARRTNFPYYLIDPLRRKPLIEDGRNPMLIREIRWGLFNRGTVFVRIFYVVFPICLFGAIFVASDVGHTSDRTVTFWYVLQMVLLVCLTSVLVANAFSKEYELGNMDMLRMTQLRPGAIVGGKTLASLFSLLPIFLAMTVSSLPILVWQFENARIVAGGLITLLVCAILSTASGLMASLLARRTNLSLVSAVALNVLLFCGVAFGTSALADGSPWWLSPITSFMDSFVSGEPNLRHWARSQAGFLLVAAAFLAYTTYVLRTRRMQDP